MKVTILELSQERNSSGYLPVLHLISETGKKMIINSRAFRLQDQDDAQYIQSKFNQIADGGNPKRSQAFLCNMIESAVNQALFIPQVLKVAGAHSVNDLVGKQINCLRYGDSRRYDGLAVPSVWEIASLDGTKIFSVEGAARAIKETLRPIVLDQNPSPV